VYQVLDDKLDICYYLRYEYIMLVVINRDPHVMYF